MSTQTPLDLPMVGGRLALDFVNTASNRAGDIPSEHLHSYGDLVSWCVRAELLGRTEAGRLRGRAEARSAEARRAFEGALKLREALYRIFRRLADGHTAAAADLAVLNEVLAEGMTRRKLEASGTGLCWSWAAEAGGLDWMLGPIAHSAAELLTSRDLERLKQCNGPTCDWLFVDESRNHSRRWCDMRDCGNRAKARRHYHRHSEAVPEETRGRSGS